MLEWISVLLPLTWAYDGLARAVTGDDLALIARDAAIVVASPSSRSLWERRLSGVSHAVGSTVAVQVAVIGRPDASTRSAPVRLTVCWRSMVRRWSAAGWAK